MKEVIESIISKQVAESLYRKYRPKTFADVVGQDHIIKTLQNSILNGKVSHAYLFCGPRGTGKTTTARILAKALLCEGGPTATPDGTCEQCLAVAESTHSDVYELDAASRTGVDNVRDEIISRVNYAPRSGKYKVYIIDEVHMLSTAAFNALLKTLEEPPAHVVFVLCTTDPHKVPETIHSRCQRFDFRPIKVEELIGRLGAVCEMENVAYEDQGAALDLIARRSNGGLRDALTTLEQVIAYGNNSISLEVAEDILGRIDASDVAEIVDAIVDCDIARAYEFVERYIESGADLGLFIDDLAKRMRDIYVVSLTNCDISLDVSEAERAQIEDEAKKLSADRIVYILSTIASAISSIKTSSNQRLEFELLLMKLINAESTLTLESLEQRISALEKGAVSAQGVSAPQVMQRETSVTNRDKKEPLTHHEQRMEVQEAPVENVRSSAPPKAVREDGGSDFNAMWNQVKRDMQSSAPSFGSILLNTTATYDATSNTVKVIFPSDAGFTFNNASKPACRTAIVTALEKTGMRGVGLDVVKADGSGAKVRLEPSAKTRGDVRGDNKAPSPMGRVSPLVAPAISRPASGTSPSAQSLNKAPQTQQMAAAEERRVEHSQVEVPKKHETQTLDKQESTAEVKVDDDVQELQDILSDTFGSGVRFKEVDK